MPGERPEGPESIPAADAGAAERLIAQRLRETVAASAPPPQTELLSQYAVARWLEGDAGHLQRAADLRGAPTVSHRGVLGPPVVASKRILRRLLHPLIDIQSDVNAANARVVAFLLAQLAVQAGCIEELRREVAELRAERGP
jgi:hypothetical protein